MKIQLLVLFTLVNFIADAQVIVQFQQPPQYQFKLEDMWKVTLTNPTATVYQVYLQGTAVESVSGLIADATTASFTLNPGTRIISSFDIMPIKVNSTNGRYDKVIQNIGGVPSGEYEICVSVIDANDGTILGIQCLQQEVMNLTQLELLSPEDNTLIEDGKEVAIVSPVEDDENRITQIVNGSYIVFNWLPPSPVDLSRHVSYEIRITEMLGMQSSYDAIQSNPAFYLQGNISATIFQYPSFAREFEKGKHYSWQVKAYLNGVLISTSEVREFSFGKTESGQIQKKPAMHSGLPGGLSGLTRGEYSNYFNTAAQDGGFENNFVFSGTGKIETQAARREGLNSEVPERFTNLELYPVLTIYGAPFSSNILLSSQQEASKQNLNSFGLKFDLETLKSNLTKRLQDKAGDVIQSELESKKSELENMTALQSKVDELSEAGGGQEIDSLNKILALLEEKVGSAEALKSEIENIGNPENLKENLEKFNLISGFESTLMSIQSFGIGTSYPSYTPYTLSGVPVSGVNIEITPAFFYLAFTGTLNQKAITNTSFKRNLFAGRFGIGGKDESHLHFTGLYAKDDEYSTIIDPSNLNLTPKANYVLGLEGELKLFDDKFMIEGEAVASMLTRDTRAADLESEAIPQFVKKLVQPKISSSFDFMYSAKSSYNIDETDTKVSVGMKMIGPGFTTLGVPNLQTDYLGYEGKIDQKLFNKKISLSTSLKNRRDNLIDWKSYTTTTTSLNINLGVRFPQLPGVNIIYSPYFQKNNASDPVKKIDNRTTMLSVITSYSYPVLEFHSSTNILFSLQQTKTLAGINDFSTGNYMLTQTASFDLPVTFAASLGIIHLKPVSAFSKITTFDFSASFPVFEVVESLLGFRIAVEKDKNKKFGLYAGASVSVLDNINFDLRLEQATYSEWDFLTEYSDLIIRFTLQAAL
ncbi:MAG: hypothetical protein K8H86_10080 [Ignavibacteriaceae bacterium]|nr:hypothetical protein [Ignavibacteriaceae bacterium]